MKKIMLLELNEVPFHVIARSEPSRSWARSRFRRDTIVAISAGDRPVY
jgi:hypothetical protein